MATNDVVKDCMKYLGLPPYHGFTNPCVKDPFFLRSLYEKYGADMVNKTLSELVKQYLYLDI